jgi:hypothetical protein
MYVGLLMKTKLERMQKEAVVVYFEVLCRYLPGVTEEETNGFS